MDGPRSVARRGRDRQCFPEITIAAKTLIDGWAIRRKQRCEQPARLIVPCFGRGESLRTEAQCLSQSESIRPPCFRSDVTRGEVLMIRFPAHLAAQFEHDPVDRDERLLPAPDLEGKVKITDSDGQPIAEIPNA
jgi:hypothetical protein